MELKLIRKDDFADKSLCLRCVSEGGSCCTGEGSGIFVTLHDVLRIQKLLHVPLDEIAEFKKISREHANNIQRDDPFFYQFFRKDKILQLKRKGGYCQYLKEGVGCIVFNYRPAICKMFPFSFDFTKNGKLRLLVPKSKSRKDEDCTIIKENFYRSKGATLKAMNSSITKMTALIKQHISELEEYGKYVGDIISGMSLDDVVKKYRIKL
jgi:Fe-S-cluster containining protein